MRDVNEMMDEKIAHDEERMYAKADGCERAGCEREATGYEGGRMSVRREFKVTLATDGEPPYQEETWADTLASIIQNEIVRVENVEVTEVISSEYRGEDA